jgi:hypothetical protein
MWAVGCVEDSCCWPCTPICLDLKFVHNTHFCSYSKFVQIHFFKFDFCVDLELVQIQFFFTTWNLFIFQRCPYIPNLSIIHFFFKKEMTSGVDWVQDAPYIYICICHHSGFNHPWIYFLAVSMYYFLTLSQGRRPEFCWTMVTYQSHLDRFWSLFLSWT